MTEQFSWTILVSLNVKGITLPQKGGGRVGSLVNTGPDCYLFEIFDMHL